MGHGEGDVVDDEDEEAHGEADPDDAAGGFGAVVLVDEVVEEEGDGEGEHAAGVLDGEAEDVDLEEFDAGNVGDEQRGDADGSEPEIDELGGGEDRGRCGWERGGRGRDGVGHGGVLRGP